MLTRDEDPLVGSAAVFALEDTADPAALRELVLLSFSVDPRMRTAVGRALRGTHDPAALGRLVELIQDADPDVRQNARNSSSLLPVRRKCGPAAYLAPRC